MKNFVFSILLATLPSQVLGKEVKKLKIKLTKFEKTSFVTEITGGSFVGQCLSGVHDRIRIFKEQGNSLDNYEITVDDRTEMHSDFADADGPVTTGNIVITVRGTSEHYKNVRYAEIKPSKKIENDCNTQFKNEVDKVIGFLKDKEEAHASRDSGGKQKETQPPSVAR